MPGPLIEPLELRRLFTTLTFDGAADREVVDPTYGDTAPETPNIDVDYGTAQSDLLTWGEGFGDLHGVLYSPDGGDELLRVTLRSNNPTQAVVLTGFDLAGYGDSRLAKSIRVYDQDGNVRFARGNTLVLQERAVGGGDTPQRIVPTHDRIEPPGLIGTTLRLEIDVSNLGGSGDCIGLDNITFVQVPIDSPSEAQSTTALPAGQTLYVITHGFQGAVPDGKLPGWVTDMAAAIGGATGLGRPDDALFHEQLTASTASYGQSLVPWADNAAKNFVLFNWSAESGLFNPGAANEDQVAGQLARWVETRLPTTGTINVHFIGHSRGAHVINAAIEALTPEDNAKIGLLQRTTLDPQGYLADGGMELPPNVDIADNYFQSSVSLAVELPGVIGGNPLNGATNFNLSLPAHLWPNTTNFFPDHGEVHDWYHWTIDSTQDSSAAPYYTDVHPITAEQRAYLYDSTKVWTVGDSPADLDGDGLPDDFRLGAQIGFHWSISAAFAPLASAPSSALDLVFVIDTTNSMRDDIDRVKDDAVDLIDRLLGTGADVRVGIVAFRDDGDAYVTRTILPMSRDADAAVVAVRSISVSGGGDDNEAVYSGLMHAIRMKNGLGAWRAGVSKKLVLFGDAPPHNPESFGEHYTAFDVFAAAYAIDPADLYTVAVGDDAATGSEFESLAAGARGEAFSAESASDVSGVLADVIQVIAPPPPPPPPPPVISVSDVSVAEGEGAAATLVVTLSGPASSDVTLNYSTADGSAWAASDYDSTAGTLTIPAGQTSGAIALNVINDSTSEPPEQFVVELSGPMGATLAGDAGAVSVRVNVQNDDPGPDLVPSLTGVIPTTATAGRKGKVSVTLFNRGDVTFFGMPSLGLYLADRSDLTGSSTYFAGGGKRVKIAPGGSRTVKIKYLAPVIPDGTYYLFVRCEASGMTGSGTPAAPPPAILLSHLQLKHTRR
jgi:hypothetical protein